MPESNPSSPRTIDVQGIMDLLPHRYPMLLVDRVLDYEPGKWVRGLKNISMSEHVFFEGARGKTPLQYKTASHNHLWQYPDIPGIRMK